MRWRMVGAGVGIIAAAVVVRTQVVDIMTVSSDSMAPTVCTGDMVVTARVHDPAKVERDDIVTFTSPADGAATIKRIVAVADQKIAIEDAELVVDGRKVPEAYVDLKTIDAVYFGPITVPKGTVFVMGDRRETSIDSRHFGPVPLGRVTGRMLLNIGRTCDA